MKTLGLLVQGLEVQVPVVGAEKALLVKVSLGSVKGFPKSSRMKWKLVLSVSIFNTIMFSFLFLCLQIPSFMLNWVMAKLI